MPKAENICHYRDCQREAIKGWTNCPRHYSAGHHKPASKKS
jgi:hypothetical protein